MDVVLIDADLFFVDMLQFRWVGQYLQSACVGPLSTRSGWFRSPGAPASCPFSHTHFRPGEKILQHSAWITL